jgi:Flp pilus assembly protein TadB
VSGAQQTEGQPSRPVAIALIAVAALAFIAVLVGLAIGQVVIAGVAGVVLVAVWFALRAIQKRGSGS